jgi:hypothetical protein
MTRPPGEAVARYDRAAEVSLQYGDLGIFLAASGVSLNFRFIGTDEELGSLKARFEQHKMLAERRRQEATMMGAESALQAIAILRDPARPPGSFDDEKFDEAAFLARAREQNMALVIGFHWFYKLLVLCVYAEHEAAIPLLEEAEERQKVFGQVIRAQCAFLSLHRRAPRAGSLRRAALLGDVRAVPAHADCPRALCEEGWRSPILWSRPSRRASRSGSLWKRNASQPGHRLAQQGGYVRLNAQRLTPHGKFSARGSIRSPAYASDVSGVAQLGRDGQGGRLAPSSWHFIELGQPHQTGKHDEGTATVAQRRLFDLGEAMRAAASPARSWRIRSSKQFLHRVVSAAARRVVVLLTAATAHDVCGAADPD